MPDNKPKIRPVEPEVSKAIIGYYSNYSEGHKMSLHIRDISHRLLYEEMCPPGHPVLNAIVDMHQPLPVKDYPALIELFESLGVYGWPPHDPLIDRTDDDDLEEGIDLSEPQNNYDGGIAEPLNPNAIPVDEDGLSPQEQIDAYVRELENEEAKVGKGRTTREQTENSKQTSAKDKKIPDRKSSEYKPNLDQDYGEDKPDKSKRNEEKTIQSMDPVQASVMHLLRGVVGAAGMLKKGVVNPISGVNKRIGRQDLNQWFDKKMDRFEKAHSVAESMVQKIHSPDTPQDEKDALLEKSHDIFSRYANKIDDLAEFSDKKIGVGRKKQLRDALDRARDLTDTVEHDKDDSEDAKKLFENIKDVVSVICSMFKAIFNKDKTKENDPAP